MNELCHEFLQIVYCEPFNNDIFVEHLVLILAMNRILMTFSRHTPIYDGHLN